MTIEGKLGGISRRAFLGIGGARAAALALGGLKKTQGPLGALVVREALGQAAPRGLTTEGEIYDFAQTDTNDTEFCGGCFDADSHTFFVS